MSKENKLTNSEYQKKLDSEFIEEPEPSEGEPGYLADNYWSEGVYHKHFPETSPVFSRFTTRPGLTKLRHMFSFVEERG